MPLPSRANELLAMSRLRLWAVNRSHKPEGSLVQTWIHRMARMPAVWVQQKELCTYVCDCPGLACKKYSIWESMFLKPEDLENIRVSSLLSLVVNTGLGLVSQPQKLVMRYNGTVMI
jgi:hypothetical protein